MMYSLLLIIILTILITSIFIALTFIISKINNKNKMNISPFECGFNPLTPSRASFSIQFFLIAILFLIFDIEIILILPFPLSSKNMFTFLSILFIMLILLLGLMYEWKNGALNWL